jgi:hypothetical protein
MPLDAFHVTSQPKPGLENPFSEFALEDPKPLLENPEEVGLEVCFSQRRLSKQAGQVL